MAKKLLINCGTCDARNTKEETLQAYESIHINCGDVLVSPETRDLLTRYGVVLNCGTVLEIPGDVNLVSINGSYEITGSTPVNEKTCLVVNGSLTISQDAQEVLSQYVDINVNGTLTCPKGLAPYLGKISVNGDALYYPDGAIILKKNAVIDKLFTLRAKNRLYWSPRRLIMVDRQLDPAVLASKGVSFSAPEVILAEDKAEDMVERIDEQAEITIVPKGTAVICDDAVLEEATIKKYGTKLYVLGDVEVRAENARLLEELEYLKIQGDISFPESIEDQVMEAVTEIGGEFKSRKAPVGRQIQNKMSLRVSKWLLEQEDEGLCVNSCLNVILDEDIPSGLILEKLSLVDCLSVKCTPEQEAAVGAVAQDCMEIGQGDSSMGFGDIFSGAMNIGRNLLDTKIINAGDYIL